MLGPIITELSFVARQILMNFRETWLDSARNQSIGKKSGRSPLHRAAAYPLQQPRKRPRFSASGGNHYNIVMFGKINFSDGGAAL
jgi:hypothetical protein